MPEITLSASRRNSIANDFDKRNLAVIAQPRFGACGVVDNGRDGVMVWGIFRRDFVFGNIGLRLFENSKILPIAANFFEIRCLESIGRRRERICQWW